MPPGGSFYHNRIPIVVVPHFRNTGAIQARQTTQVAVRFVLFIRITCFFLESVMPKSEKRRFYGSVTVSERGQVVIPVKARRDFEIKAGDKLLVVGDLDRGIAMAKQSMVMGYMEEMSSLLHAAEEDEE